jgi:hypothetical protein
VPQLHENIIDVEWKYAKETYVWNCQLIYPSQDMYLNGTMYYKLFVDAAVEQWYDEEGVWCPHEIQLERKLPVDVLQRMALVHHFNQTKVKELCSYHEHEQDEATVKKCKDKRLTWRKRKREQLDEEDKHDGE